MKEYLIEKFQELSEEYLQDNCATIKEYAGYGDTQACVGAFYADSDIQDSYNHAIDKIESEIKEAFKEIKIKFGVSTDQFSVAMEKSKENSNTHTDKKRN
jgi:hypothetical protein